MKRSTVFEIILPSAALLAVMLLSITCGNAPINWQNFAHDTVFELRLVRVLGALVVGSSLALAGLVLQAVLRNVLAEPFTLGISGGAGVGAALAIVLDWQMLWFFAVPLMAWAGALAMLIVVLLIAGNKSSENLLLSGVIGGTAASGVLMYIVSIANKEDLASITWWMLGDLQSVDAVLLSGAGIFTLLMVIVFRTFARELNAVAMGSEIAWSMGVNSRFFTCLFIVTASLLAAQTVALAGIIAFAGLIVPHLVRMCYGSDHKCTVLPTALWGGVFLIICDWLSRMVHKVHELPIGVLTAAVGGTLFIYILNRRKGRL